MDTGHPLYTDSQPISKVNEQAQYKSNLLTVLCMETAKVSQYSQSTKQSKIFISIIHVPRQMVNTELSWAPKNSAGNRAGYYLNSYQF